MTQTHITEYTKLELVGSICEVQWSSTNRMAKRQCEKCLYVVRGYEPGMACLQLIYDSIDGIEPHEAVYWVPTEAIQFLRVISEATAIRRIKEMEREAYAELPRG